MVAWSCTCKVCCLAPESCWWPRSAPGRQPKSPEPAPQLQQRLAVPGLEHSLPNSRRNGSQHPLGRCRGGEEAGLEGWGLPASVTSFTNHLSCRAWVHHPPLPAKPPLSSLPCPCLSQDLHSGISTAGSQCPAELWGHAHGTDSHVSAVAVLPLVAAVEPSSG